MSVRVKLAVGIGALTTAVWAVALLIGYVWGTLEDKARSSAVFWVAAALGLFILWVLAWGIAVGYAARIRRLLSQAGSASGPGAFQDIQVGGRDEIAKLASLFNKLSGDLHKGEEARNQLVSDAAHELRTPVAILRGHLETMLRGAAELKRDNLISLLDETRRMTYLIQELQQISLAESGRLKLDRSWIGVSHIMREIIDIFSVEAEDKGIRLVYEVQSDRDIYCDASRIKQVLINVVGNAIRHTPENGKVRIRQSEEMEGEILVEVADTGPGIPADKLPYIFHRFYRVDDSRNRSIGGTGLGLAIAKQFAEAHGGSLEAVSEEGAGTTIRLRLPVFPDA